MTEPDPNLSNTRAPLPPPSASEIALSERALPSLELWADRQRALADLGHDPGAIDGRPGPRTLSALRAFQAATGLDPDGIWGPKTRATMEMRLLRSLQAEPSPEPPSSYVDMLGDVELDDEFWDAWVDLTARSAEVVDARGRPRRKGVRKPSSIKRVGWHQTGFAWSTLANLRRAAEYSSHHKINSHVTIDRDGALLLTHPFDALLWAMDAFNPSCISVEVMGNFEGTLGRGNWFKPDKFGRHRPLTIQLVRARQLTLWLLNPTIDSRMPSELARWVTACEARGGSPLIHVNGHCEATDDRGNDPGSELWYHVIEWSLACTRLKQGPPGPRGQAIPPEWRALPVATPHPRRD